MGQIRKSSKAFMSPSVYIQGYGEMENRKKEEI